MAGRQVIDALDEKFSFYVVIRQICERIANGIKLCLTSCVYSFVRISFKREKEENRSEFYFVLGEWISSDAPHTYYRIRKQIESIPRALGGPTSSPHFIAEDAFRKKSKKCMTTSGESPRALERVAEKWSKGGGRVTRQCESVYPLKTYLSSKR